MSLTSQSVQLLTRHKACQRGCEWQARIAREVLRATEQYLNDQCGEAPTAIAEYVGELLEGARYMWETHDAPQPSVSNQQLFTFRISNTLL